MSERVKTDKQSILQRTVAAEAIGWIRAFSNVAPRWENKSAATLLKSSDSSTVCGIAIKLSSDEVKTLDFFEGYPDWYDRVDITLKVYEDGADQLVTG